MFEMKGTQSEHEAACVKGLYLPVAVIVSSVKTFLKKHPVLVQLCSYKALCQTSPLI